MRLHAVLFPETAYRLEGFTLNPKSKELAPIVSQPHVEVDTSRPLVSKDETHALMASMGFAPENCCTTAWPTAATTPTSTP